MRKANAVDNFSATTTISTSGSISVPDNSETTIKFENISMGDPTNGIEVEVRLDCGAITSKDFLLRFFQFELGGFATQFVTEPVHITRFKCKRHYRKLGKGLQGAFNGTTDIDLALTYEDMRTTPTGALLTTTPVIQQTGVGSKTGSASAIVGANSSYSKNGAYIRINGFTGGTAKDGVYVMTDDIIALDARFT